MSRTAGQLSRTPTEFNAFQLAEQARIARELRKLLCEAREDGAEWYGWVVGGQPPLSEEAYQRVQAARAPQRRASRQRRNGV